MVNRSNKVDRLLYPSHRLRHEHPHRPLRLNNDLLWLLSLYVLKLSKESIPLFSQALYLVVMLLNLVFNRYIFLLQFIPLKLVVVILLDYLLLLKNFFLELRNFGFMVLCLQVFFYFGLQNVSFVLETSSLTSS